MEQELQTIQNQLWFLIVLFSLLVATNIVCYFSRKSEKSKNPRFGEMWDKGELDRLLKESGEYLYEYPNHQSALYFRAKALVAKRQNLSEAKMHLTKLKEIEPTLKSQTQEILDEIENIERG